MKETRGPKRDPYYYWKMVNMTLACGILILAILILLGEKGGLSGIMELAKNKKVIGYICSVFAGILTVALIITIMGIW